MASPSQPDILDNIEVPDSLRERWQSALTLLGELLQVPAPLVMRVHAGEIEVFAKGQRDGNVYEEGERAHLDTGLYCETVMATRSELEVPDACKDPVWAHNPDVKLGMISYLGLPLEWPSGHVFGTICVLDRTERHHSELHRRVLSQFRDLIQSDLALVFENHLLRQEIAERQAVEAELRGMHEELRRLAARLQLAREQERSVIAHRLHDDIAQALTAVKMDLDSCHRKLPEDVQPAVNPFLTSITAMLDDAIRRVRSLFDDLIPAMLEDLGLVPTIEWEGDEFARRTGIPCIVQSPKRLKRIDRRTALLLYRIVQQALAHVVEPVSAGSVHIVLGQESSNTVLRFSASGHAELPHGSDPGDALIGDLHHELANRGGTLQVYRSLDGEIVMQVAVPSVGRD